MKKVVLLSVNPFHFLLSLPLFAIFALALRYRTISGSLLGLYPLIVLSGGLALAVILYLCRTLTISFDEVTYNRIFGHKEFSYLKKGSRLELRSERFLSELRVYGIEEAPALEWLRDDSYVPTEINLMRRDFFGFQKGSAQVMKYFGIPENIRADAAKGLPCTFENEDIAMTGSCMSSSYHIEIVFKKTL